MTTIDPGIERGRRLKALMALHAIGDANATQEIVRTLLESIEQAGDKQPDRAAWLGISVRYLRHLLSEDVGLTKLDPNVHGRARGFNDRGAL